MRLRLVVALTLCGVGPSHAGELTLLSSFHWTRQEAYFGGISGIDLSPDGGSFIAIGDNGLIVQGEIKRRDDVILGLNQSWIDGLRKPDGRRVGGEGPVIVSSDAEGLALLPDGGFVVSFERMHRVWRYADWTSPAEALPGAPHFDALDLNGGLEALAVSPQGVIFAIPEKSGDLQEDFPIFRLTDGAWQIPFRLPRIGLFLPVGADFDPQGRLYVLERSFLGIFGFSSRVRRLTLSQDAILHDEVLLVTVPGTHDNLEGLAVWTAPGGETRVTMVSDDNNKWYQRTEIVEYALREGLDPVAEAR